MKGYFVGLLQNIWRFLWQVSAFGGLHIATKITKYHCYDWIFGKYWHALYFEYILITYCDGFGNCFFLSPGGTWTYLKIKAIHWHSHAGNICYSCCQQVCSKDEKYHWSRVCMRSQVSPCRAGAWLCGAVMLFLALTPCPGAKPTQLLVWHRKVSVAFVNVFLG